VHLNRGIILCEFLLLSLAGAMNGACLTATKGAVPQTQVAGATAPVAQKATEYAPTEPSLDPRDHKISFNYEGSSADKYRQSMQNGINVAAGRVGGDEIALEQKLELVSEGTFVKQPDHATRKDIFANNANDLSAPAKAQRFNIKTSRAIEQIASITDTPQPGKINYSRGTLTVATKRPNAPVSNPPLTDNIEITRPFNDGQSFTNYIMVKFNVPVKQVDGSIVQGFLEVPIFDKAMLKEFDAIEKLPSSSQQQPALLLAKKVLRGRVLDKLGRIKPN
jgi:hypothetical protein